MSKDQSIKVEVIDDRLVISIGIAALAEAAERCPNLEHYDESAGTFSSPSVTDQMAFARGVAQSLEIEAGDLGLTPVQQMLDEAFVSAAEFGAEGIDLPGNAP